jgi:hypothetical protein
MCYKYRKNFLTGIRGIFLSKIKYSNILLNFLPVERRKGLKTVSYLLKRSVQSSAYEFLFMEMAASFKRVACYVKEKNGLILLKLKFIGINKLTDFYLI